MEGRFKKQAGEKDRIEEFLGKVRRPKGMDESQQQPGDNQRYRVGNVQPPHSNGDCRGDDEKEDEDGFVGHGLRAVILSTSTQPSDVGLSDDTVKDVKKTGADRAQLWVTDHLQSE
jgi:hypothetical protein